MARRKSKPTGEQHLSPEVVSKQRVARPAARERDEFQLDEVDHQFVATASGLVTPTFTALCKCDRLWRSAGHRSVAAAEAAWREHAEVSQ